MLEENSTNDNMNYKMNVRGDEEKKGETEMVRGESFPVASMLMSLH